jgi:hypothetical protein
MIAATWFWFFAAGPGFLTWFLNITLTRTYIIDTETTS